MSTFRDLTMETWSHNLGEDHGDTVHAWLVGHLA